jgi:CRISPR-associated protein Cas1
MTLFHDISDEQNLLRAWLHVKGSQGVNAPSAGLEKFEQRVAHNLAQLSDVLRKGEWRPSKLTRVLIPKSAGGNRLLGIPSVSDRVVERAIASVVDDIVDCRLSAWCFAYRRGLSVSDAVAALCEARDDGCEAVIRTDLKDCFDRIPLAPLSELVASAIDDVQVRQLLDLVIFRGHERSAKPIGLAQGSPLSPMLSNLYLSGADEALYREGIQVIRYADDIAIPIIKSENATELLKVVRREYERMGMCLSESKTKVTTFCEGVDFLGERVGSATPVGTSGIHSPLDTTLYVATPGALLRRKGKRIRIERPEQRPVSVPFTRTRQIVVFGRVGLTTPFLQAAMQSQIEIVFISDHGRYFGRMDGLVNSDPFLREQQYLKMRDKQWCLGLSRVIARAKILNQRRLLLHLTRRSSRPVVGHALRSMSALVHRLESASTRQEVMGCEGRAARCYFAALGELFGDEWNFRSRQRRPPPDPVNSMLSFGYTILFQEAVTACLAAGLDPYASFLHQPRVGRQSLALDLMEEFRPCIVDSVVARVVRTRALGLADFSTDLSPTPSCRLNPDARKRLVEALEKRFLTEFAHPHQGRRMSWRQALGLHASLLARELKRDVPRYQPVIWK